MINIDSQPTNGSDMKELRMSNKPTIYRFIAWIALFTIVVLAYVVLYFLFFHELEVSSGNVEVTEMIHNLAVPVGGAIAIIIATYRSIIASKQQTVANRTQLDDQFQKGAKMLECSELATKMAGVFILEKLSKEHTIQFHTQVVDLLAVFVRHHSVVLISKKPDPNKQKYSEEDTSAAIAFKVEQTATIEALMVIARRNELEVSTYTKSRQNLVKALVNLQYFNSTKPINFLNMSLTHSNFKYTDLRYSNFSNMTLTHSFFDWGLLEDAQFQNAILNHSTFVHADMFGGNFHRSHLNDSIMEYAKIASAEFVNAYLESAILRNSYAYGTDFTNAYLPNAELQNACLEKAMFPCATLTGADFSESNLKGANLNETYLEDAILTDADISGAYFLGSHDLTQEQLNVACQSEGDEPHLDNHLDWDKDAAIERYKNYRKRIQRAS